MNESDRERLVRLARDVLNAVLRCDDAELPTLVTDAEELSRLVLAMNGEGRVL